MHSNFGQITFYRSTVNSRPLLLSTAFMKPDPIIAVGKANIATATTATKAAIIDPRGVKSTLVNRDYNGNSPVSINIVGNIA